MLSSPPVNRKIWSPRPIQLYAYTSKQSTRTSYDIFIFKKIQTNKQEDKTKTTLHKENVHKRVGQVEKRERERKRLTLGVATLTSIILLPRKCSLDSAFCNKEMLGIKRHQVHQKRKWLTYSYLSIFVGCKCHISKTTRPTSWPLLTLKKHMAIR